MSLIDQSITASPAESQSGASCRCGRHIFCSVGVDRLRAALGTSTLKTACGLETSWPKSTQFLTGNFIVPVSLAARIA